ncbi:hypothetical protein RIF29_17268 [Crotalaria pallida]|uniref:Uncharacterized protein n=1 Tax=Crotalaria pallida TaxID=3830 RepID=A0AAN9FML2_CROPI
MSVTLVFEKELTFLHPELFLNFFLYISLNNFELLMKHVSSSLIVATTIKTLSLKCSCSIPCKILWVYVLEKQHGLRFFML